MGGGKLQNLFFMTIFTRTVQLLKAIRPEELETLRIYLNAFSKVKDGDNLKSLRLLDEIVKSNYAITFQELQTVIYGKRKEDAFKMLLHSFYNKITDSLILDTNIHRPGAYKDYSIAYAETKKMIIQAHLIRGRGQLHQAELIYDYIIEKAGSFELYNELVEALECKKSISVHTYNNVEEAEINRKIEYYKSCKSLVQKTYGYFSKLLENVCYKSNNNNLLLLTEAISDIEHSMKGIYCENVEYYLGYIKTQYYQELGDYKAAEKEIMKILALLETSPAININIKYSNTLVTLADHYIYTASYKDAIYCCLEAEKYLTKNEYNYAVLKETEFAARLYAGEHEIASEIIGELLFNKQLTNDEFRRAKRYYFKACVCFKQKNYKEVNIYLEQTNELKKDKEGWYMGIRLLEILTCFEQEGPQTSFGKKINNYYKHIERLNKNQPVRDRDLLIKKILYALNKSGFDFNSTYMANQDIFEQLLSKSHANGWQGNSAELINFGEWYMSKVDKTEKVERVAQKKAVKKQSLVY